MILSTFYATFYAKSNSFGATSFTEEFLLKKCMPFYSISRVHAEMRFGGHCFPCKIDLNDKKNYWVETVKYL
jgi:hypothetical protein